MAYERICLICGASEPCMTEADLKPGDPGVPCTFEPEPRVLYNALLDILDCAHIEDAKRIARNALNDHP